MVDLVPALALADEFRLESFTLPSPLLDEGEVNTVIEAIGPSLERAPRHAPLGFLT